LDTKSSASHVHRRRIQKETNNYVPLDQLHILAQLLHYLTEGESHAMTVFTCECVWALFTLIQSHEVPNWASKSKFDE